MNLDIRKNIFDNFEGATNEEFKEEIERGITKKEEITLPGMGVFFEVVWNNADDNLKNQILDILKNHYNK